MPAWRASSSLTLNRISQVSVCCVCCCLAQLHGALVLLDGLAEVGDLAVQRRERDPLVADDRGRART